MLWKSKKVLITGATGFTGGHLAKRLLNEGAIVSLLVRDAEKAKTFRELGAEIIQGDLSKQELLTTACQNQEYVFHVAALFREAKFPNSEYFEVNTEGTKRLLEASKKAHIKRFIFCSTNGVHGTVANPPGREDSPLNPFDVYQDSKIFAEHAVLKSVASGELDACILRPAMIWGEGDKRFLKLFRSIAKRRFPIIGTGQTLCHWLYVKDLVQAFLLAALSPNAKGKIYLIAGERPVTLEYTAQKIAALAGTSLLPFKIPVKPVQIAGSIVETLCKPFGIEPPLHRRRVDFFIKNRAFDISAAQTDLGYKPEYVFEDEVKVVFDWYKKTGWM